MFQLGKTLNDYKQTRLARFTLSSKRNGKFSDRQGRYNLLDELMSEIPGKDNYESILRDNAYGMKTLDYNTREPLNSAYYHRYYKVTDVDAMGGSSRSRGYADQNLFMAQTSQDKVNANIF